MNRPRAGAILLAAGGLLVAAGGFLPPGHDRSHVAVLGEAVHMLWHRPDGPISLRQGVFYSGEVIGLAYPMAAGLAFAAAAVAPRRRSLAAALFIIHALALWTLGTALIFLSAPGQDSGPPGKSALLLLAASALIWTSFALLAMLPLGALKPGVSPTMLGQWGPADAVNLIPAGLLLLLEVGLLVALSGKANWPATGYLASSAGALAVVGGLALRRGAP